MKVNTPKFLYHYTDINALDNILKKEHMVFWATNILYLNDPKEIIEGMGLVKKFINDNPKFFRGKEKVKDIVNAIRTDFFFYCFLIAFSECADNLNMWRGYADNGRGCTLCLESDKIKIKHSGVYEPFIQCKYCGDDIRNDIENYIRLFLHDSNIENANTFNKEFRKLLINVVNTCVGTKDESYKDEKEWRYTYYYLKKEKDLRDIKFRVKNNYIVPYIELQIPKDALKEIIVGPTSNPSLTKKSIEDMLKINDYSKISVIESHVPYRE